MDMTRRPDRDEFEIGIVSFCCLSNLIGRVGRLVDKNWNKWEERRLDIESPVDVTKRHRVFKVDSCDCLMVRLERIERILKDVRRRERKMLEKNKERSQCHGHD